MKLHVRSSLRAFICTTEIFPWCVLAFGIARVFILLVFTNSAVYYLCLIYFRDEITKYDCRNIMCALLFSCVCVCVNAMKIDSKHSERNVQQRTRRHRYKTDVTTATRIKLEMNRVKPK